jgi:hypothetical protein
VTPAADYERQALETAVAASDALIRGILEAVCRRDKLSLDSTVTPGEPARNYELALRLGIEHIFGLAVKPQPARKAIPGRRNSMDRRSLFYPPLTGYLRPAERKFYVWQDRVMGRWRWCCTLCDPPCYGSRSPLGDSWQKILVTSMPHHFSSRRRHHDHVRRTAR